MDIKQKQYTQKFGSVTGLIGIIAIGFIFYFGLSAVPGLGMIPSYNQIAGDIHSPVNQVYWFLMNFTEPNFYGGFISSIFLLAGACVAWQLSIRKSKFAGFEICYGNANMWPWIFAGQVLSLLITQYVFGYLSLFEKGNTWIPTFIVLVSVPASMLYLYGPSVKNVLIVSFIGGGICTPTAYWISQATASLGIPGAANNVFAMAIVGWVAGSICNALPMDRVEVKKIENPNAAPEDHYSASWLMRRTITDLTEPLFYGNDVAAIFLLVGVCIEWILNPAHATGGAMMLPAIILSQFISGGVGVFLYANKYKELGWYATYVPVVCTAPACVLVFGPSLPVIIFASVTGAVIGAPLAEFVNQHKADYMHGTIGNVVSMGLSTLLVASVMHCMPWF